MPLDAEGPCAELCSSWLMCFPPAGRGTVTRLTTSSGEKEFTPEIFNRDRRVVSDASHYSYGAQIVDWVNRGAHIPRPVSLSQH